MSCVRSGSKWPCRDIRTCLLHWSRRPYICPGLRRAPPLKTLPLAPRPRAPASRAASFGQFPDPEQDLLAEQLEIGDRLFVVQQTALAHHQEVPKAADMVVKGA